MDRLERIERMVELLAEHVTFDPKRDRKDRVKELVPHMGLYGAFRFIRAEREREIESELYRLLRKDDQG